MKHFTNQQIAAKFKALVENRNLSVNYVAKEIGMPQRTLSNQLSSDNSMSLSTFLTLAGYFNVDLYELSGAEMPVKMRVGQEQSTADTDSLRQNNFIPLYSMGLLII